MSTTGKIVDVYFDKVLDTYEKQQKLVELTEFWEPDAGSLQNAGNFVWRPVDQRVELQSGWDLANKEGSIIEQTYPAILGTPQNDFVKERADDMRDIGFWERRGQKAGTKLCSELNKNIASAVATQGSLYYRDNATSGYDFIAQAQAIMNERQSVDGQRNFILNDRDNLKYAEDLAGRQTLQGRPEDTWKTGQIGQNIAEFDVHVGSYLINQTGGANPATTVTGNQSFKPEGGTVNATTGVCTNVDYRTADIAVAASTNYNIGDKISFANAAVDVESLSLEDKEATGTAMTFSVVAKPDATTITVYPKPIAYDDAALSTDEKAYANINTVILNAATVDRLNITTAKSNIFFDSGAVEVLGGSIPARLMKEFDGKKVIEEKMPNGQRIYMVYDGDISDMSFRYRCFSWWGVTIKNPAACGVAHSY